MVFPICYAGPSIDGIKIIAILRQKEGTKRLFYQQRVFLPQKRTHNAKSPEPYA